jgi:tetratricopeptide (TPR) repeat protein
VKTLRLLTPLVLSITIALTALPASAQGESEEDVAQARRHYEQGAAHFEAEEYEQALMAFQQARAYAERGTFLYNIHLCYERLGQLPEAIEYLELYLEADPDPEERSAMEQRLAELESRLAEIEAELRAQPTETAPPSAPVDGPWGPPTLAGMTLGVAGLALGTTFMVMAGGVDTSACEATSSCTPEALDRAGQYQTIGIAGLGIGAIGLGLGLYYLLTSESDADVDTGETAHIEPALSPTYAGVRVHGRY